MSLNAAVSEPTVVDFSTATPAKRRSSKPETTHPDAGLIKACVDFAVAVRLPISEPQPSAVIRNGRKWIGPSWAQVDENLVLRVRPTKTETTTGREVVIDFRACPMVMEEFQAIPQEVRTGPLIVNPKTGAPYTNEDFRDLWRGVAEAAGIPPSVWNRDLRKSGSTEARAAGAPIDDLKKMMGHAAASRTTSKVYDRAHLEAHRRIAAARNSHRDKK